MEDKDPREQQVEEKPEATAGGSPEGECRTPGDPVQDSAPAAESVDDATGQEPATEE